VRASIGAPLLAPLIARIAPPQVLFTTSGPTQRLVIFEDAAVVHRTPLTAYALAELQAKRQRPIVRVVFCGSSADGQSLGFVPPSAVSGTESGAAATGLPAVAAGTAALGDAPAGAAGAAGAAALEPIDAPDVLPLGLRRALGAYAHSRAVAQLHSPSAMAEADAPGTAPGTALELDELMADVLEEYVRGGREIVAFLRDGFDWANVL
jgi:hypothetical protein